MASQRYEEGGRVRRHLLGILSLVLLLSSHAGADVTISGTQIRGRGANGVLRCTGVRLENPGTIVSARDSGAGFWLQSDTGQFLRFNTAQEALGTPLTPGTWYAYPNLYRDQDEAGVSVTVGSGGGGVDSAADVTGVWAWFANGDVTFRPDGTLVQGDLTGRWTKDGPRVNVQWSHGYYDFLTLSADGQHLSGYGSRDPKATSGFAVSANRKAGAARPGPDTASVAGVWEWFVNGDVTFHPDGSLTQGNLRGQWSQSGSQVRVQWSHGYYDFLTLSADGRRLSGYGSTDPKATSGFGVSGSRK